MKKQKFISLLMLSLLFLLAVVYSAHVFAPQTKAAVHAVLTDTNDDNTDSGEENVKEASHHLFLAERSLYYLKPMVVSIVNLAGYISKKLPEAYLQLNTPPPDFAIS